MEEGTSRRRFLKKTGVIAAVAAFGGLEAKTALAEQKPTAETDKETEKYRLPDIEYQDKQLDGFVYQNSHDRTGKIKVGSPENGKIIFSENLCQKKRIPSCASLTTNCITKILIK